jgi:hypothetical protein
VDTRAVKSCPRRRPSAGTLVCAPGGKVLASATSPGARTAASGAAAAGPTDEAHPATTTAVVRRCHADQRAERHARSTETF